MSGAVPPPAARPLEEAARVPRLVCPGCGRCGPGDPAPAPEHAPLRAGVARCGGGVRASPGGVPSTVVRGVWIQALSLPRLHAHWAGCWGPPPTCGGRGCVGVEAQHCPLGLHALWGLRAAGVVGGRPLGGWPATFMRGVWCQALSLPRPPVLWSGQSAFCDLCVPGAVGAGVGTQHRRHIVHPCGPALLAVGVAEGRPRGGCLPPLGGASEVRRCPSPDCPPTGRAVGVRYPRAVGASVWVWGPNTVPLAYTHTLLGGVEDKVVGPNDPPVKKTREHSAAKQLWPNRDVRTHFPAGAWRGSGHRWRAQHGCRWSRTALATPGRGAVN